MPRSKGSSGDEARKAGHVAEPKVTVAPRHMEQVLVDAGVVSRSELRRMEQVLVDAGVEDPAAELRHIEKALLLDQLHVAVVDPEHPVAVGELVENAQAMVEAGGAPEFLDVAGRWYEDARARALAARRADPLLPPVPQTRGKDLPGRLADLKRWCVRCLKARRRRPSYEILAHALRILRDHRNWTLTQIAKEVGTYRKALQRNEIFMAAWRSDAGDRKDLLDGSKYPDEDGVPDLKPEDPRRTPPLHSDEG